MQAAHPVKQFATDAGGMVGGTRGSGRLPATRVRELAQDLAKPQGEVLGRLRRQVSGAGPRHGLLWELTTGTASTPANATKLTSQCTR